MTGDRWRAAWDLYQAAADLPPGERQAFVESASPNPETAAKVLDLLARLELQDQTNATVTPDARTAEWAHLGKQFGRFVITAPLGRGGMGEVYGARDTDLDRPVALKFLILSSVGSSGRVERFVQEAQTASALNHPGIVTVHEVLRTDEAVAIVMELVEGESLRQRCGSRQPLEQVCKWGRQIAQALSAAHAHGLVHGDIKPENVMLRPDGFVKVLDFGLSRRLNRDRPERNATVPAGTLRYMSPEQTQGEPGTAASDIFALGIVLHELATGAHPFAAGSPLDTAHAIAEGRRSPAAATPRMLRAFGRLIDAMLDPDPRKRPTTDAVAARLDAIASPSTKLLARWVTTGTAVAASVAAIVLWTLSEPEPISPTTLPWTNYQGSETEPAFSPDGTRIAFAWTGESGIDRDVYVKSVEGTSDPIRITPGDANSYAPAWSPDGRQIAVLRGLRGFSQDVLIVPAAGGDQRLVGRIADAQGFKRPVAWWPDGQALLVRDTHAGSVRLVRLPISGAPPEAMTSPPPGEQDALATPSPNGSYIAFARFGSRDTAVCLLRTDGTPQQPGTDPCIHRTSSVASLAWQPDGGALFVADASSLWRLALSSGRVTGVRKIANGDYRGLASDPRHGRFAFTQTYSDMNLWRMDRDGTNVRKIASSSAEDSEAQFSPDGQRIAFRSRRTGAHELWVAHSDGTGLTQVTTTGGHLGSVQWSPDGNELVFDGSGFTTGPFNDARHTNIYTVSAAGGPVRRLTDDRVSAMVPSWSRDGRWVYYSTSGDGHVDLWKVASTGGEPVKVSPGPMFEVIESNDGRYFYFTRLFKEPGVWRQPTGGGKATLLRGTEGVRDRHWEYHSDGIYFVDGTSSLMLRFFRFDTSNVTPIVEFPPRVAIGPRAVTVSPDGRTVIYCQEDLTLSDIVLMEMP